MRGKILILLFLLSMSIISVAMTSVVKAPVSTMIYVDPPTTTAVPGDFITVNVMVSGVAADRGVSSWEFKMVWDSSLLYTDYSMISEGDFLMNFQGAGGTVFTAVLVPPPPTPAIYMQIGCSLMDPVTAYGSGILATISFLVLGEGKTSLDLYDNILYDFWLTPIPHNVQDGYFSNTVIGNLVGKSAWPEHHHFSISKDEDGVQNVTAKARNLGEGYGYLRVNVTVWAKDGTPITIIGQYLVDNVETRVAPGQTVEITVKLWESRETAWATGKWYVSANCLSSADGIEWNPGEKLKAFSFAVVS